MIKIEIKSTYGSLLFEHSSENNTIKETVEKAVSLGADLRGANLDGADLRCANLRGANLDGADLRCANLYGADGEKYTIEKAQVFSGLYNYIVIPYITDKNEKRIKMGCFDRSLQEWNDNFWNNNNEFPNDNSEKSNMRLFAFEVAKRWFDVIEKTFIFVPKNHEVQ